MDNNNDMNTAELNEGDLTATAAQDATTEQTAPNEAQGPSFDPSITDPDSLTPEMIAELPKDEFAYPGPVRDTLLEAIFSGAKTSTASLYRDFELTGEALPKVGDLNVVIDSAGNDVAILRYTAVTTTRFIDVDDQHAKDEGEGYTDAIGWRQVHRQFWTSDEYLAEYGEDFTLDDDTPVVLERFELARRL
ncbi:MAG: ASCH domain-containing protein [Bifidobacterium crudilactis]|jgi:uncharacterized protein YhfF|nr:ASCH domain-containing protein [Bifidobacterium crudilactis]